MDENLKQVITNHFSPNTVEFVNRDGNWRVIVRMSGVKHDIELSTSNQKVGVPIVDELSQLVWDYLQGN